MSRWTHVVIHHGATDDSPGLETEKYRRYHMDTRGWRDIGYHFVCELIDDSFQIVAGRSLRLSGAHCPGMNRHAIGFCFAGDFSEDGPPHEQLVAAANFLSGLMGELGIPVENISPHRAHRQTSCPGEAFRIGPLADLIRSYTR